MSYTHISYVITVAVRSMPSSENEFEVSPAKRFVLILSGSAVCAAVCALSTCNTASDCDLKNTCTKINDGLCTFKNNVAIEQSFHFGYISLGDNNSAALYNSLCGPGDRAEHDSNGNIECVPFYPYPSGVNFEIMDDSASTPARRSCGKWIDAGGNPLFIGQVTRRGNHDNLNWEQALLHTEDVATANSRTATSAMAKFRSECKRTSRQGPQALLSAAAVAYKYLEEYVVSNSVDRSGFLRSIGYIMSHRCPTLALYTSNLRDDGAFMHSMIDGFYFGPTTMSTSLFMFGESIQTQADADEANNEIREAFSVNDMQPTAEDVRHLVEGAYGKNGTFHFTLGPLSLLDTALKYYDRNPTKAIAYLKGTCAFCSYNPLSSFLKDTETHDNGVDALDNEMSSLGAESSFFARVDVKGTVSYELDIHDVVQSSRVATLSDIMKNNVFNTWDDICLEMMRHVFVDEVEAARFDATVSSSLYERFGNLVNVTKMAVCRAAEIEPIKRVLNNISLFQHRALHSELRIVGAPRGTWAGLSRPIPNSGISIADGMFTMILKQSRASFLDELVDHHVEGGRHACDHVPFYSQTSWNAYVLRGIDCAVYFLGIAHRPMLDTNYDDATLMSRGLHVVAHELAHISESVGWNATELQHLLVHYHPHTHTEAIADVLASVAILETHLVTRHDFIILFCQVWCSREPIEWSHPLTDPPTVHPSGNSRCNNLVATLDEFFPLLGL